MMRLLAMFLVSACAATTTAPGGGDDAPIDEPGVESATVRFLVTTIRDERFDTIDFATGGPVHAHDGAPVQLGAAGCAEVYKHAYLLDAAAPRFGRELSPNPLAFQLELKNESALDASATAYRVRAGTDVVLDWTAPPPSLAIELHRTAIPALGTREGTFHLDIRTRDRAGVETITTACWNHHPLAAPVEATAPQPDALATMTLPADSPISALLGPSGVGVLSRRFVHHTAEPVALAIDLAQPVATYAKRVVDDYVVAATGSSGMLCSNEADGFESTDPECSATAPADPAPDLDTSGPLTTGTWTLTVLDEATSTPATDCTVVGLRATCMLPPRVGAARAYRAILSVRDVAQLAPAPQGPFAEHTVAGKTFTGRLGDTTRRCAEFQTVVKFGMTIVHCKTFAEHRRIHALDRARIAFEATPFAITASPSAPAIAFAPVGTAAAAPSFSWDAGDDDLPGPQ